MSSPQAQPLPPSESNAIATNEVASSRQSSIPALTMFYDMSQSGPRALPLQRSFCQLGMAFWEYYKAGHVDLRLAL